MELKKFLIHLTCFAVVFLALNALLIAAVFVCFNRVSYKLPNNKSVLVIGDSHTALAINDKVLSQAVNISSPGEAYLYSYVKLKRLLTANKQINTVLVSFNFDSIYQVNEDWVSNNRIIVLAAPRTLPLFGSAEYDVFKYKKSFYTAFIRLPIANKKAVFNLILNKSKLSDLHLGGFISKTGSNISSDLKLREKEKKSVFNGFSPHQINYLQKIITHCQKNGVNVILLNTPLYHGGKGFFETRQYYSFYNKHLSNVPLWDYSNSVLKPEDFFDIEHLNARGTVKFSKKLNEDLTKGR